MCSVLHACCNTLLGLGTGPTAGATSTCRQLSTHFMLLKMRMHIAVRIAVGVMQLADLIKHSCEVLGAAVLYAARLS